MNQDIISGKWKQMRGQVKQWWGKLTDDDLDRIDGAMDKLAGSLQERYGWERERADREIRKRFDQYERRRAARPAVGGSRTQRERAAFGPPALGDAPAALVRLRLRHAELVLHRLHTVDPVRHLRRLRGQGDVRDLAAQHDDAGVGADVDLLQRGILGEAGLDRLGDRLSSA